jgi:diaminohydroxyphosphoribosylaminopyrimidine deaminase/5-amino-6-(5-phosphoribosylamino)uracil reductase
MRRLAGPDPNHRNGGGMTPASPVALPREALRLGAAAALQEAAASVGRTAPNPPVGCAAFDQHGRLLAIAHHQGPGQAHAEIAVLEACRMAGNLGAVHALFVTLEPCNHHGRTPPCAEAILRHGVKEVYIGAFDPNPQVAGGGARRLRDAGVQVRSLAEIADPEMLHLAAECAVLLRPFIKSVTQRVPWIIVKQAFDMDGSMLPPPGQKTFTSPTSIRLSHLLRRKSDAIVTGSGTVIADHPMFTVREVDDFEDKRRWLGILDRSHRVPEAYLHAARARGLSPLRATDFAALVGDLAAKGVMQVLVEAGPTLSAYVLGTGQWDEHVCIRQTSSGDVVERRLRGAH